MELNLHLISRSTNTLYSRVIVCLNGFFNKPEKQLSRVFPSLLLYILVKDINSGFFLLFSLCKSTHSSFVCACVLPKMSFICIYAHAHSSPQPLLHLLSSGNLLQLLLLFSRWAAASVWPAPLHLCGLPVCIDLLASPDWSGKWCSITSTSATIFAAWRWSAASASLVMVRAGLSDTCCHVSSSSSPSISFHTSTSFTATASQNNQIRMAGTLVLHSYGVYILFWSFYI